LIIACWTTDGQAHIIYLSNRNASQSETITTWKV
jgi:hypothetical protein